MFQKAKNQIINIGSDTPYTINQLADKIINLTNTKPNITNLPARNEVFMAYSDHTKAKTIFNISKETNIDIGLQKMIDYALKIGPLYPKKFKNIEITKNLPSSWSKLT